MDSIKNFDFRKNKTHLAPAFFLRTVCLVFILFFYGEAATIQFQQNLYQTTEDTTMPFGSSRTMLMTITLSDALGEDVEVAFSTQDGSAIGTQNGGTDYISQSGTVSIPAGETSATLPMYIIHDQAIELTENFFVQLSSPSPSGVVYLGPNSTATVEILEQTSAPVCYADNFESPLDDKWRTLYSNGSFTPHISNGHLKLTPGRKNIATAVTKDYEFPSNENLIIVEFTHYAYGGCFEEPTPQAGLGSYGADGMVAVLYDSAVGPNPVPGAYGGSMGYAQGHSRDGFQGGWLGLGLDEYGNFANPNEGRVGGPGFRTNAAVIRGDGSGMSGYNFLAIAHPISPTIAPLVNFTNPARLPGYKYKMTVDARDSAHLFIRLERDINDGNGFQTIINQFDAKLPEYSQSSTPDYVRFALTAGTGGGCNAHEIDNLVVRGNCSVYTPSLAGAFRITEDSSTASWASKWVKTNLTTKVAPLSNRYCVLAGTNQNDSASPLTSSVSVDINVTNNDGFNQQIISGLTIPPASSTTCFDLNVSRAEREMQFVISNSSDPSMISSSDTFSIRPNSFVINVDSPDPLGLIAGKSYTLDINATSRTSDSNTIGYTTVIGGSGTSALKIAKPSMPTCARNEIQSESLIFNNGRATLDPFSYNDAMEIEFTIEDSDWTLVDQASGGCIMGSDSITSTPVGCVIRGTKNFKFSPDHFTITAQLRDHSSNFTYLSQDLNMSAVLDVNITARSESGSIAEGYNSACYANDIDMDIGYLTTPILPAGGVGQILFSRDGNNTLPVSAFNIGGPFQITNIPKDIFSTDHNGTGRTQININFNRNTSVATEPFRLTLGDINATDATSGTSGTLNLNQSATFYYGRVHAPDYRGVSPIDARIGYEVYCRDCNRTAFGIGGPSSPSSNHWFINTSHTTITQGVSKDKNASSIGGTTTFDKDPTQAGEIVNGVEQLVLRTTTLPSVDRIELTPSPWLVFDPFNGADPTTDFMVEFLSRGTWGGGGTVDKDGTDIIGKHVDDQNVSTRTNRRISW